ncbi:uncharacterized protein CIMG_11986 [Coccidioides immitis RS]|uniref:Uncharacterized protein n=3 Tax=Coccidioides immitis TaxID=5501 RepID=A0A0D8JXC2_COCIM|nr:uncharacterized protein CIMG_11986 [Coccidioides immitis RS]KJF60923.1 hypothetical protein CIMG_11986 [Coccidioides immitis RS]KMP05984.1 hypothetical protein CIRG_05665 [Coccidioides immitis RMSCC 2394]KMU89811.1 hypothetical protein CIHG_07844 [Coccidioides immitis H538.4]
MTNATLGTARYRKRCLSAKMGSRATRKMGVRGKQRYRRRGGVAPPATKKDRGVSERKRVVPGQSPRATGRAVVWLSSGRRRRPAELLVRFLLAAGNSNNRQACTLDLVGTGVAAILSSARSVRVRAKPLWAGLSTKRFLAFSAGLQLRVAADELLGIV